MAKASRKTFSQNLGTLMRRKNVSLEQMALEMDIEAPRIKAWLDGDCYPLYPIMVTLCDYFDYLDIYTLITSPLNKIK